MACELTSKRDVREVVNGYFRDNYSSPSTITDDTEVSAFGASVYRLKMDHNNIAARVRRRGCSMKGFSPTAFAAKEKVGDIVTSAWKAVKKQCDL